MHQLFVLHGSIERSFAQILLLVLELDLTHVKCFTVLPYKTNFTQKKYIFSLSEVTIFAFNRKFLADIFRGICDKYKIIKVYSMVPLQSYTLSAKAHLCLYCCKQQWGPNVLLQSGQKVVLSLKHFIFSGTIKCCFDNHSCVKDWTTMQDRVYTRAKWVHISYCQP